MTIGQRVLQARQEAGLSQRQLAGTEITRNMLSAIEHGTATPSVATLRYLSERLGRPVGYFLGEDTGTPEGWEILSAARQAFDRSEFRRCAELLAAGGAGEILAREWALLGLLARLALAKQALEEQRLPYARELLARLARDQDSCPYFTGQRELALLMARAGMDTPLPPDEEPLLLRAERALEREEPTEALRYLDACDRREDPRWHRLRGECAFRQGDWRTAANHFHKAEADFDLRSRLEDCYRELEDYKMAYFYASGRR